VRMTRRERIMTRALPAAAAAALRDQVAELERVSVHGDPAAIRRALVGLVPEYRAAGYPAEPGAAGDGVR